VGVGARSGKNDVPFGQCIYTGGRKDSKFKNRDIYYMITSIFLKAVRTKGGKDKSYRFPEG
jgi:hypothetical protein